MPQSELPDFALFPKRLQEAMRALRISQSTLAADLGLNRATVHRWLGGAVPSLEQIAAAARSLQCNPRWLAGMTEEAEEQYAAAEIARLNQRIASLARENEELRARMRGVLNAVKEPFPRRRRP